MGVGDSGAPVRRATFATESSPAADVTVTKAAEELVDHVRLVGNGDPCAVVAHSLDGVIATAAAEASPELFSHVVYVSAYVPITASVAGLLTGTAGEVVSKLLVADPAAVRALRHDPMDPVRIAAMRDVFYGDVDMSTADAATAMLGTDTPLAFTTEQVEVTRDRFGSIPHTYLVCAEDRIIPEALQRRLVRDVDAVSAAPTYVIPLAASHSPFLSQPAEFPRAVASVG